MRVCFLSLQLLALFVGACSGLQFSGLSRRASLLPHCISRSTPLRNAAGGELPPRFLLPKLVEAGYGVSALQEIAKGLNTWSAALQQGLLPEAEKEDVWPTDPALLSAIKDTFTKLELPKLVKRHPLLLNSVLKAIVDLANEFQQRIDEQAQEEQTSDEDEDNEEDECEDDEEESNSSSTAPGSDESFKQKLGESLMKKFESAWAPPLGGLKTLDEVFGPDHDLLSDKDCSQDGVGGGAGSSSGGFGLFDGVWKNSGWTVMATLQERLKTMTELKQLMRSLGHRPSVKGDVMKKTPPQMQDDSAPLGIARDSRSRDEISGLRRSNSFEMLLPSEAMLLSPRAAKRSRRPKLLFLSRFAEAKLQSYEMTGWNEVHSTSKRKPWRHYTSLPVSTGGPIIVCLDTSASMLGPREQLAKAVVLEAATLGARDNRPFYLLAFSGYNNIAECELKMGADKDSLLKLLGFLSKAFSGGTDVAQPMSRAVELLENTAEWASADILLVTDGELMNPPLPPHLMDKIKLLERERGLNVHGLLVGPSESKPLESICTQWDGVNRMHSFLSKYDALLAHFNSRGNNDASDGDAKKREPSPIMAHRGGARSVSPGRSVRRSVGQSMRKSTTALSMASTDENSENSSLMPLIVDVTARLSVNLIEREAEVKLLLLAALSREHIVLLGPPGTGKSELARRMGSICGGVFFERLLTRFTAPEELFGPLSLQALERDEYVRNTQGYLPASNVAFLDEIFKSSSSILNSFLTILNERLYDNGNERIKVPLLTVVGASNELPDSEELDALYDRFLFRKIVEPISDAALPQLLMSSSLDSASPATIREAAPPGLISTELADRISTLSDSVTLPPNIIILLTSIRTFLRDEVTPSIYVSDRRLKKAAKVLKVSAYCHGRTQVGLTDCLLLEHILWYAPEDRQAVSEWLWSSNTLPEPDSQGLSFLANAVLKRLEMAVSVDDVESLAFETTELNSLLSVVKEKHAEAERAMQELSQSHLFLDTATTTKAKQALAPKAKEIVQTYEKCFPAIALLQSELAAANLSTEGPTRINSVDSVCAVRASSQWRAAFGSSSSETKGRTAWIPGDGPVDANSLKEEFSRLTQARVFTKKELAYTQKEAKKLLSKDDYIEWKEERDID